MPDHERLQWCVTSVVAAAAMTAAFLAANVLSLTTNATATSVTPTADATTIVQFCFCCYGYCLDCYHGHCCY